MATATDTASDTTPAWIVDPSGPLRGDVAVRGSKNAVTKHLVASMLGRTPSTITNAPDVGDVDITISMLEALGCVVNKDDEGVTVDPSPIASSRVPIRFSGMNRIPILMVGPLLHRVGEAFVPLVGGDDIGARPINFHVSALEKMGAEITITEDGLEAKASQLRGAHIELPYPSVGATETVLMTASLAKGRTVLDGAATEPEVIELALFLQRMGARIEMRPNRRFIIDGVDELVGASHRLQGRPHRSVQLPRCRTHHRRRGPRSRVQPGTSGHRHQHPPRHGRAFRDHRFVRVGMGRHAQSRRPSRPTLTPAS